MLSCSLDSEFPSSQCRGKYDQTRNSIPPDERTAAAQEKH